MFNQGKTFFFLGLLTLFFVYIGKFLAGTGGMTLALIIALSLNFFAYWFSDRLVLSIYRARAFLYKENPEVHQIVYSLTRKAGIPKPKLFLVPTAHPNAFATGRDPDHASIALTHGIIKLLNMKELSGVLAHEISHIKNRDTLIQTVAAALAGAVAYISNFFRWALLFGYSDDEDGGGFLGSLLFSIFAPIAAILIQLAISRSREYLADETAAGLTRDPDALADALEVLSNAGRRIPLYTSPATHHLFIVKPTLSGFINSLFSTHPPIQKRIAKLRYMAEVL